MAKVTTKSVIQLIVLFGIGILLIWLSLRQVAPVREKIFEAFRKANYFWVIVSMLISFLSHFLRAYRWNYLLKPLGHKTGLLNATCHVIIGYFANYGIPRSGELSRCTLAARYDKVPFEVGLGTVITERIVDLLLFVLIFLLTLVVQFNELIGLADKYIFSPLGAKLAGITQSPVKMIVLAAVLVGGVALFFLLRKKVSSLLKGKLGNMVKGLGEGIGSIRKMEKPLNFIVLSVLIWACYFYSLYACFFALNGTSGLSQSQCLTLLLFGTFGVMFSPGGLGVYPAILYAILFYTFKVDEASSFALPWLSWTGQFILIVVLGIISLILLPIVNRRKNVVS